MWLARFVDKARLNQAGSLNKDFEPFFGHPLATDGAFLKHFGLKLADCVTAFRIHDANDDAIATWFLAQPGVTPESIFSWNAATFDLGKPGHAMERSFRWAHRKYYSGAGADERVNSVFSGIAWDEGYLDEMPST
jgi:hypothetical protein